MSDRTNSGYLARNDKGGNDKRPDYRGKLDVDGMDYDLAGWIKDGKDGKKILSLKVQVAKPKFVQPHAEPAETAEPDPLPF